jgi:hypothetical protein
MRGPEITMLTNCNYNIQIDCLPPFLPSFVNIEDVIYSLSWLKETLYCCKQLQLIQQ